MANMWANVINLIMTSLFFHPLLPLSIPIGFAGLLITFWTNKVRYLVMTFLVRVLEKKQNARGHGNHDGAVLRKLRALYGSSVDP